MIMLDNTIVNVALPAIEHSLHMSISSLEWIVTAYALTFAALLITGGKLGDMFGRRKMFIVGLVVFTLASLACGLAPSAGFLIGARAVQGIGAALMNPATLSIITATFPPKERGQAIGIWAGVSALALAIGPLLGGLIVDNINWHWIFYVNVPVGVVGIVVSYFFIRESRDTSHEQSIDLPGLVTSGAALLALSYALIEGNNHGWTSPEILGLFVGAAVLLAAFILLELRQRLPMLDLSLFKIGSFVGANLVAMLVSLGMFGVFFYISLYVQNILGYSPTKAGAIFLPMTVLIILVAPIAGKLSDRVGSRWLMGAGMGILGVSLLLYQRIGLHTGFWSLLPLLRLSQSSWCARSPRSSARTSWKRSWPHDERGSPAGGRAPRSADRDGDQGLLGRELPGHDDGGDRPRGGRLRADPLPSLRLEARPLPRGARSRVGKGARLVGAGARVDRQRPRSPRDDGPRPRDGSRLQVPDGRALGAGPRRGGRGPRAPQAPPPPHARGPRLHGRRDPARPGGRRPSSRPERRRRSVDLPRRGSPRHGRQAHRPAGRRGSAQHPPGPPRLADELKERRRQNAVFRGARLRARRPDRALAGAPGPSRPRVPDPAGKAQAFPAA